MTASFKFRGARASATRPAAAAGGENWARNASAPAANDGTVIDADLMNDIVANLRQLATSLGQPATVDDDDTIRLAVEGYFGTLLGGKAPLVSPALTGTPTAPTASGGTNTTQIATTAFVQAAVAGIGSGTGDVTAAANFGTDNRLIRSDGTGKGVQASLVTVSDTGLVTIPGGLQAHNGNADGVVIGYFAGTNDTSDSINIGFFAGAGDGVVGAPSGDQPIRIGRHAGYVSNAGQSVIMGHAACQYTGGIVCPTSDVSNAVILGHYAFRNQVQYDPVYAFGAVLIGADVAASARAMQNSVVLGTFAAETTQDGADACIIGMWAGRNAINCAHSVMMGRYAGKDATNAQQSVLLGYQAGMSLSRNHTLVIESNGTYAPGGTGALIYGEFDNRVLKFNGFTTLQSFGLGAPVTKTANFTVGAAENFLINNKSGSSCTATLPSASTYSGRVLGIANYQAQTVVSASSNVVPAAGGSAGTAILPATAGAWAILGSDGTNWAVLFSGGTSGGSGVALGDSPTWTGQHTWAAGTITASVPLLYTQTWNNSGVTFVGRSTTITSTASATGSQIERWEVTGAGAFELDKGGEILIGSAGNLGQRTGLAGVHGTTGGTLHFGSHNGGAYLGNTNAFGASGLINNSKFATRKDMNWSWSSDFTSYGTPDIGFARNAAGLVEVNSGTAAAYRDMKLRTLFAVGNGTSGPNLNLTVSAAPTSPVDGDVWREDNTNTGLKIRINGVTKTVTVS